MLHVGAFRLSIGTAVGASSAGDAFVLTAIASKGLDAPGSYWVCSFITHALVHSQNKTSLAITAQARFLLRNQTVDQTCL